MRKKLLMLASCLILCLLTTATVFADDTSRNVEILSYEVEPGKNIYYYPAYGEITDCDDTITDLIIPSEINGVTITTIGRNAFAGNFNLKSVSIPDTITTIEIGAFSNCGNLNNINIPNSVTIMKKNAFYSCQDLKDVKLSNNIEKLSSYVFGLSTSLDTIDIPSSVNTIESHAFTNSGLTSLEIPGTVKNIEYQAFSYCSKLTDVVINNGVENIASSAFIGCERLTSINLPKSIKQIDAFAFDGCWRLAEILVDNENENYISVDGVLLSKDKTILIRYPEGKRDTSYTIPDTVTKIEHSAFSGCEYLKDIYYSGSEYQWQQIVENGYDIIIPETTTIHCLGASVTGIKLNQTEIVLPVNGTAQLIAAVEPDNAACKDVEWHSQNRFLVSVDDNGLIKANYSTGPTTITATTLDGKFKAECKVTVVGNIPGGDGDSTDSVSIATKVIGGKVTVTSTRPNAGQTVTINITANEGYKLDTLVVTDNKGNNVELTKVSDNKYTFVMPAGKVTVTPTFVKIDERPNNTYVLTLDANGGYIVKASILTQYVPWGSSYKLPTPTQNGYKFQGWNDGVNTYNAATDYVVNHDTRLIALWQQNASSGGSSGGGGGSSRPATNKPDNTKPDTTRPNTVTADNINQTFADVGPGTWYAEYVAYVYNKGMMKGTDNGNFEPNAKTTRGMIVTMLYRLEGEPNVGNVNFNDVSSEQWFSNAIAWASENGVVTGYANGTFVPNGDITREQLAAILYRYAQAKGYDVSSKGNVATFSDSNKISGWASDYMQWAVGCGLMNGDNGALRSQGTATRAEVAAMLMRFCENIAK